MTKRKSTKSVYSVYTYIQICYIHIDFTVFNRGNLLNWLYHGLNLLYENLRNLAALLCAYIKTGFFKENVSYLVWTFRDRAFASGRASGARPPHLKYVPPHFTFGPRVAAYIQYSILKMCPPFWILAPPSGFGPPTAKSWRRACVGTRFSLILGTRWWFSLILGTRIGSLKRF